MMELQQKSKFYFLLFNIQYFDWIFKPLFLKISCDIYLKLCRKRINFHIQCSQTSKNGKVNYSYKLDLNQSKRKTLKSKLGVWASSPTLWKPTYYETTVPLQRWGGCGCMALKSERHLHLKFQINKVRTSAIKLSSLRN